jgi:hypothetical protein
MHAGLHVVVAALLASHEVQPADVVLVLRPAALLEGTVVRLTAVQPDGLRRQRAGEHRQLGADLARDAGEQRARGVGHLGAHQQVAELRVPARVVQVHDVHRGHPHAAALEDVELDGGVPEMLFLG